MSDNIKLPLIPLRGVTIFPNMVLHFDIGREKSINAIDEAMLSEQEIFVVAQIDPEMDDPKQDDIKTIGTICQIKQIVKIPGGTLKVLVEGKNKGKIKKYLENDNFFEVEIQAIEEKAIEVNPEIEGYFNELKKAFINFIKEAGESTPDMIKNIKKEIDVQEFSNMVSSFAPIDEKTKQEILETLDIKKRIELILVALEKERKVIRVQKKIANKMKKNADNSQKEYYLREQLKYIQEELGENDEETRIYKEYEEKVSKIDRKSVV